MPYNKHIYYNNWDGVFLVPTCNTDMFVSMSIHMQGHGNSYGFAVNMAPVSCWFGSLPHALKH